MSEQIQKQQSKAATVTEETPAQPADLRNDELDESTSCCLADIDAALAEAGIETEREQAKREIENASDAELSVLVAKYAHLGFQRRAGLCCDYIVDGDGSYVRDARD